jgi:hypothetical protein
MENKDLLAEEAVSCELFSLLTANFIGNSRILTGARGAKSAPESNLEAEPLTFSQQRNREFQGTAGIAMLEP